MVAEVAIQPPKPLAWRITITATPTDFQKGGVARTIVGIVVLTHTDLEKALVAGWNAVAENHGERIT